MNASMNLVPYRDPSKLPFRILAAILTALAATALQLCLYALNHYSYPGKDTWLLDAIAAAYLLAAVIYAGALYFRRRDLNFDRMAAFGCLLLIAMFCRSMTPTEIPALIVLLIAVLCAIPVFRHHGIVWAFVTVVLGVIVTLAGLNGFLTAARIYYG